MLKRIITLCMVSLLLLVTFAIPVVAAVPEDRQSMVNFLDYTILDGATATLYSSSEGSMYVDCVLLWDDENKQLTVTWEDTFTAANLDDYYLIFDYTYQEVAPHISSYAYANGAYYGSASADINYSYGYFGNTNFESLSNSTMSYEELMLDNVVFIFTEASSLEVLSYFGYPAIYQDYNGRLSDLDGVMWSGESYYFWTPYNEAYFEVDNSDQAYQDGYNQALQDIEDRLNENGYIDAYMLNWLSSISFSGSFSGSPMMAYAIPTVIGQNLSLASSVAAVQQSVNNADISLQQVSSYSFTLRVDQRTALPSSEQLLPVITSDALSIYSSYAIINISELYINYYDADNNYRGMNLSWSYNQENNRYIIPTIPDNLVGARLISYTIVITGMSNNTNVVPILSGIQVNFGSMKGINSTYQSGFEKGYVEGAKVQYDEAVDNAYQDGFRVGREEGYLVGKDEGLQLADNGGFYELIAAVVDVPLRAFNSIFNFEVLGVNMRVFIGGMISLCVVVIILKKVL